MPKIALNRIRSRKNRSLKPAERESKKASHTYASGPLLAQQAIGNQAVQRMLQAKLIQAKLTVNPPDDEHEKEADQSADTIMRMPEPGMPPSEPEKDDEEKRLQTKPLPGQNLHLIQRVETKKGEDEEKKPLQTKPLSGQDALIQREVVSGDEEKKKKDEETPIQTKSLSGRSASLIQRDANAGTEGEQEKKEEEEKPLQTKLLPLQTSVSLKKQSPGQMPGVTSDVESHIAASKGGGERLPESARAFVEPRFSQDFSGVRVHSDAQSNQAARALNAQAFTTGQDIYFGAGSYQVGTKQGDRLLAHELTHVVQQGGKHLQRAQARQGTTIAGTPSNLEKGSVSFLSIAHVALDPSNLIIHRQSTTRTPIDVDKTVGEVEDLYSKNDYKGALEKLNTLTDMLDLLAVVAKLHADDASGISAAYTVFWHMLQSHKSYPTGPTASIDASRLLAAFDAAPTRTLRNYGQIPQNPTATHPTVSEYRKRPGTIVARPGDWGDDPANNTWIAHDEGIRTYWGTNVAKKDRSSAWLAKNPSNHDYTADTKRAIGSFLWGSHDFAIYFAEKDASDDLKERILKKFSNANIIGYITAHISRNEDPKVYFQNMRRAVPELKENDPITYWTSDDSKWEKLIAGFKSAEGWVVGKIGTTVTKENIAAISTNPKDASLVDYYKTLVGAP